MSLKNREKTYLYAVCLILFQSLLVVCQNQGGLTRTRRSIRPPDYGMVSPVPLHIPVYAPKVPFLGELSESLAVGKVIQIHGYIPKDLTEFQVNLCSDCSEGPIQLHVGVRFLENVVVRNTYQGYKWETEERDNPLHPFPFVTDKEFGLRIEIKPEGYFISVNGLLMWKFAHRISYTFANKIEIKGGPVRIWKIEYTTALRQYEKKEGDTNNGLSVHIKGDASNVFQQFTVDLRCECKPRNSASYATNELEQQ